MSNSQSDVICHLLFVVGAWHLVQIQHQRLIVVCLSIPRFVPFWLIDLGVVRYQQSPG